MNIEINGQGDSRKVIVDGLEINERAAWKHAVAEQGFDGDWQAWLEMPASERQEYELGAAGIPTA